MALAVRKKVEPSENWRSVFFDFLDTRLDKILEEYSMDDLGEISKAVFQERAEILGHLLLGLSESSKQYDVQDVEAWLSSETAYETASETYERITGITLSEHHMHGVTNAIGEGVGILDTCPSQEDIHKKIDEISENKFRRPIMMLALDGAHGPMRPEPIPHPRKGKRGSGEKKFSTITTARNRYTTLPMPITEKRQKRRGCGAKQR
ncbi:MAG: hypothetical protein AAB332_01550 [Planctomycetota bacterium]